MGFFDFFKRKNKPPKAEAKQKQVYYNAGLALSGGGSRGIAHIGALRAFEENGIEFSCVAGTSAGAIVGALYAAGFNSYEIEEFARSLKERDLVNNRISRLFILPSNSVNLENAMRRFIGETTFKELKLPFTAVAVDVITGEEVNLSDGSVAKAVSASSAVPGVFTPVEWPPYRLIDGGLQNTIPSDVARHMGAEKVIAVDINSTRGSGTVSKGIVEILKATFRIAMKSTALKGIMNSDVIITPDLQKFKSNKLEGFDQMLEIGYQATMAKMDEIKVLLGLKKPEEASGKMITEPKTKGGEPKTGGERKINGEEPRTLEPYSQEWFDGIEPETEPEKPAKKEKKEEKKRSAAK